MISVRTLKIQIKVKFRLHTMSASNSASDSQGTILFFDLKVLILFIEYDAAIKYGLHLKLSSQKRDLEMPRLKLRTFRLQN